MIIFRKFILWLLISSCAYGLYVLTWHIPNLQKEAVFQEIASAQVASDQIKERIFIFQKESGTSALEQHSVSSWSATSEDKDASQLIQATVGNYATSLNIPVRSVSTRSLQRINQTSIVEVRIEGDATYDRLLSFIAQVENNDPELSIYRSDIRALNSRTPDTEPRMFFQFSIRASLFEGVSS